MLYFMIFSRIFNLIKIVHQIKSNVLVKQNKYMILSERLLYQAALCLLNVNKYGFEHNICVHFGDDDPSLCYISVSFYVIRIVWITEC